MESEQWDEKGLFVSVDVEVAWCTTRQTRVHGRKRDAGSCDVEPPPLPPLQCRQTSASRRGVVVLIVALRRYSLSPAALTSLIVGLMDTL